MNKFIGISIILASAVGLVSCVEGGSYRDGPGYRTGGLSFNEHWRDRDRARYVRPADSRGGPDIRPPVRVDNKRRNQEWRDLDRDTRKERARPAQRDRDIRPDLVDQYGRPILYPNR